MIDIGLVSGGYKYMVYAIMIAIGLVSGGYNTWCMPSWLT